MKLRSSTALKSEIAESVMNGLRQVFVENNIDIQDEKVDLVAEIEGSTR